MTRGTSPCLTNLGRSEKNVAPERMEQVQLDNIEKDQKVEERLVATRKGGRIS